MGERQRLERAVARCGKAVTGEWINFGSPSAIVPAASVGTGYVSLGYQEPHRSDSRRPFGSRRLGGGNSGNNRARRKPSWTSTSLDSMCVGAQVEAAVSEAATDVVAGRRRRGGARGGFRRRFVCNLPAPPRTGAPYSSLAMLYWPAPPLSHPTTIAVINNNPSLYLKPTRTASSSCRPRR